MSERVDNDLFDVRVVESNIRRGLVTQEQYDAFLKDLADEEGEGANTETQFTSPYWERHFNAPGQRRVRADASLESDPSGAKRRRRR